MAASVSAVLWIEDSGGARVDAAIKAADGSYLPTVVKLGTGITAAVVRNGPIAEVTLTADAATGVASVTGAAPITISGTAADPVVNISTASGAARGAMPAAHFTLIDDATDLATASTLVLRDGGGDAAFGNIALTNGDLRAAESAKLAIGQDQAVTAAPYPITITGQTGRVGTNEAGGDIQILTGQPDGSGDNGSLSLRIGEAGATGSVHVEVHTSPVLTLATDATGVDGTIDAPAGKLALSANGDIDLVPAANVDVTGALRVSGQAYEHGGVGWKDLLGYVIVKTTGAGNPTLTTWGNFQSYGFAIEDSCYFEFHIPHDYVPGTGVYFHVHWHTSGTSTNTAKWDLTYTYAHGYARGAFNTTGTTVSVTQAATGVAYTHMIAEISSAILASTMETDGILKVRLTRKTNGGTDISGVLLVEYVDVHYQGYMGTTPNKNYPFA